MRSGIGPAPGVLATHSGEGPGVRGGPPKRERIGPGMRIRYRRQTRSDARRQKTIRKKTIRQKKGRTMEHHDRDAAGTLSLGEGFKGQVIRPGSPGYDESRAVYNGSIDRRPALVVRPVSYTHLTLPTIYSV